jgi:hypothetical protein
VTVGRTEADGGLERAREVAALIASMSGSTVAMEQAAEGPSAAETRAS